MKNITTKEFCTLFDACKEGHIFARNYADMRSCYDALLAGKAGNSSADWAIWVATREGVMSDRDLRLFAVRCARRVQHLMRDARLVVTLDVAERYALGQETNKELTASRDAAKAAAKDAEAYARVAVKSEEASAKAAALAAEDAAWSVVYAAAWYASSAARSAAWAAGAAAWAAGAAVWSVGGAERSDAWDAEREEQLKLLAEFGNPFTEDAKT